MLTKQIYSKRSSFSNTKENVFLSRFTLWSWIIILVAAALQLTIFWSLENFVSVLAVLTAWALATKFVLTKSNLLNFTLSTYLIFGFSLTQYFLPIVFILLEGKPLIYNLKLPYDVFFHSILAQAVLILAHFIYKSSIPFTNRLRQRLIYYMNKGKLFTAPTDSEIWVMGILGLGAMFVSYFFIKQSFLNESEGSGNKFIEGLVPFAYAPYFILLKNLYSKQATQTKNYVPGILIFTALLFAVGIGANARSLFITGIVSAGISYLLGLLLGKFSPKIFTTRNVLLGGLGVWLLTGPLSDIGTAMVIVRSQRGTISKTEMLQRTLDVVEDKEALQNFKRLALNNRSLLLWDEHYFDNIFLARFCNLKFNDLSLEQAEKIDGVDEKMTEYSLNRLWTILPQPVLAFLSIDIDKKTVLQSSFGDFLYSRSGGGSEVLGGFRTGQFAGTGMASFGWWYILLLGIGIIPVYFLLDLFAIRYKAANSNAISVRLAFVGLLSMTSIFTFLSLSSTSESVINIYNYIIRSWIQIVVLYYLVFLVSRLVTKFLGMSN